MLENTASVILGQDTILIFLDAASDSDQGGISGDQLRRKIAEAQQGTTAPPNKAINQPMRAKPNERKAPGSQPLIEYTKEPGKIGRSTGGGGGGGYKQVSLMVTGHQPVQSSQPKSPPCLLPAKIEYQLGLEDTLLTGIFQAAEEKPLTFRLAPSYALYLTVRFHYAVEFTTPLVKRITGHLQEHIEHNHDEPGFLAFWMANSSELLNFLRQDRHLSRATEANQEELAQTVQLAFKYLVHALEDTLLNRMAAFLQDSEDDLPGDEGDELPIPTDNNPTMYDIIEMLNSAMSLLRRCRVNAALTIQLFSQLFHFINMFLFNTVVRDPDFCCRRWGTRIRLRLSRVEAWAEKQGLELAAECHLARVTQGMALLQGPKYTLQDVSSIRQQCFKLNSLQLETLLGQYQSEPGEKFIPPQLIDQVVASAQEHADQLTREDGREVALEEDPDLQLPFLLPEDGYTSDVLRGVPGGLHDFIEPLQANGLCGFSASPEASGNWTVYFMPVYAASESEPESIQSTVHDQLEPVQLQLKKKNGGLGLSIVAARGSGQAEFGIYIKSVVPDGAAFDDGRLDSGDLLVAVDDTSLHGLTQDRAADVMRRTGDIVRLTIIKNGAHIYGLDNLLSQPSPQDERKHILDYRSPEQVARNGTNNYKHIAQFTETKAETSLPVPPSYLLDATVEDDDHEYTLPPPPDDDEHEYAMPPPPTDNGQMVSLKKASPPRQQQQQQVNSSPPRHHQKQSSGDSASERRSNQNKSTNRRNKGERKRAESKDKSKDTLSTGGTLGRRNKGGMWEDPQQRMIQEQLDSMRDDEIMELQKKPNKSANDEERLRVLMKEQEFSRQLQRELVQSGTSEVDSMSEEDFSNIPDRPDRDRLQKYAEMVTMEKDEELEKIRLQQEQQQQQLARQQEEARKRQAEERAAEEQRQRQLREDEEKARQEELRREQLLLEQRRQDTEEERHRIQEQRQLEAERRRRDEEDRARLEERRLFEEQRRQIEAERKQIEQERRELEENRRAIERLRLQEDEARKQREEDRRKREERAAEKDRIRKEQQELEQMKKEMGMDDIRSSMRPWEQQSAQLRDLEDTIEQTISDKPKSTNHLYAKDIAHHQPRIEEHLEKERRELEDKLSRPYKTNAPVSTRQPQPNRQPTRPTSSYVPPPSNHAFNKRPLSSYNPKTYTSGISPTAEALAAEQQQQQSSSGSSPSPRFDASVTGRSSSRSDSLDSSFNSPNVIGAQETYNDPRERKLASIKRDNSMLRKSQPDPSKLAFKDRHKLFEGQNTGPVRAKPKMSRKLQELEEQFGNH